MEIEDAIQFFHSNDVDCVRVAGIAAERYRLERVKGSAGVIVYVGPEELIRRAEAGQLPRVVYSPRDWEGRRWSCGRCGADNDNDRNECTSCGWLTPEE